MQKLVQLMMHLCIHQRVFVIDMKGSFSTYCLECHAFCFVNALAHLAVL